MDVHRGSCGLLWRLVGHSSGKSYRRLQDSQDQGSPLVGKNILTGSCLGWPKCQSRNLWDLSSNSRSSDLWLCGTFIDDAFMMHRFIASCWVTLIILFVAFPYPENIAVAIGDHDPWFKVKNTWNPFLLWSPWFWRRPWSRTLPNSTTHVTGKVMEGHRWWKIKTAVVVGGHWTHWFPPIRNMHPYNLCIPHLRTTLLTCIPRSCAFKNDENNPVFTILMRVLWLWHFCTATDEIVACLWAPPSLVFYHLTKGRTRLRSPQPEKKPPIFPCETKKISKHQSL